MDLRMEIGKVTGIIACFQKLEPCGDNNKKCELEEGDDVFCDWELPNGYRPLHCAAFNGNIEAMRSWLASGADVNTTNKYGLTPLMCACLYSKEECAVELLRLGANVQMKDCGDNTALHVVGHTYCFFDLKKMERIAKMLIEAGCDSTIRNDKNETFIDILKRNHHNELATILEEWMKSQKNEKSIN